MTRSERKNLLMGLAFISPWIVGLLALTLYPVLLSLYYSFCDYDVLSPPVWIGTLNYTDMVTDNVFWLSLWNTVVYTAFAVPLGLMLSLLIAVLLNQPIMGRSIFRTIFFLPSMVPLVAVAMIWLWIFNGKFGLLNEILSMIGIDGPNWLTDPKWTKPAIVITSLWQTSGTVVIYLAALQDVPRHLYEAAEVDGAKPWHRLWHITIPMISPVIYFNMIMGLIGSLQVFVGSYVMLGGGGPDRSALFYAVYLYENAFKYLKMGYASAMAWLLFLLIVLLTWIATRLTCKHIHYGN